MQHLTPTLKSKVRNAVLHLLAEWSRIPASKLEPTAFYGLRLYREGSVLNMHVDREETHVLSAILEVGHLEYGHPDSDLERAEQWPLQIVDHAGVQHAVPSRAGQLILYESATCAHGRPEPSSTSRPQGWPSAYLADKGKQDL
mmetsp:Transcript_67964/g.221245  ORF Transcript_67964/g.221245 Transcript_67964/m.221245 type:complete len:143 (-) Transcript_67964:91-519(-)